MKTIFIILICVACLIPILIGGGFGLGRIFENHCTNDTDCARSEKCSNNKCISACDGVSCGSEGHCEINNDHNSSCICVPDKYFDPIIKECATYCTNDTDCARSEKCSNNKCISACDGVSCGIEGHCEINNDHNSSCICVPDKEFDPYIKECATYVATVDASPWDNARLLNGKRYFYFYMYGNGILRFKPEKNNEVLFEMEIKNSSFEASEGGKLTSFRLPSNISNSDKKRGFWFRWDESTMNFGTIENNTTLHSYSIRN
ncbi:hypothetical protein PV325_001213, partial [Microctonus aethiopoides]